MKRRNRILLNGVILCGLWGATIAVNATEATHVETQSTIGFTGTYVPIGTPNPGPPITEVAKPVTPLPQTNTVTTGWLTGLGTLLLSLAFWGWRRKETKK